MALKIILLKIWFKSSNLFFLEVALITKLCLRHLFYQCLNVTVHLHVEAIFCERKTLLMTGLLLTRIIDELTFRSLKLWLVLWLLSRRIFHFEMKEFWGLILIHFLSISNIRKSLFFCILGYEFWAEIRDSQRFTYPQIVL